MDEIARRYEVEGQLRSLRQACDTMNRPMFSDDRVAVLGDFLRTCDSMISGFEALYDGIEMSCSETKNAMGDSVAQVPAKVPTLELWMNDNPFVAE